MNPGIKDGKIQMMSFYADNSIIASAIEKANSLLAEETETESEEDADSSE